MMARSLEETDEPRSPHSTPLDYSVIGLVACFLVGDGVVGFYRLVGRECVKEDWYRIVTCHTNLVRRNVTWSCIKAMRGDTTTHTPFNISAGS